MHRQQPFPVALETPEQRATRHCRLQCVGEATLDFFFFFFEDDDDDGRFFFDLERGCLMLVKEGRLAEGGRGGGATTAFLMPGLRGLPWSTSMVGGGGGGTFFFRAMVVVCVCSREGP